MKAACNRANLKLGGHDCLPIAQSATWALADLTAAEQFGVPLGRLRGAYLFDAKEPQMAIKGTCTDTPNWKNGKEGHGCAKYAKIWCADGKARPNKEGTLGKQWNFPEKHCCVCGKASSASSPPPPSVAAPNTISKSPFGGDTMCAIETTNNWMPEPDVIPGAKDDSAKSSKTKMKQLVPFVAKDVRIHPLTFTGSVPAMRVEFFGSNCVFCRDNSVGIGSGILLSEQLRASSIIAKVEGPENARLFGRSAWRSAQFFSCGGGHGDGDNCHIQVTKCDPGDSGTCFLRPMINLPFNAQVRKAAIGRFFTKKDGSKQESVLPLVWKLAWSSTEKKWVIPKVVQHDTMPILRWNTKKTLSPEVCLSHEAMSATSYTADPDSGELSKLEFSVSELGVCRHGMKCFRAGPSNSTLHTVRNQLYTQLAALKSKGMLVPQEYSKQYLEVQLCPKDGNGFAKCEPAMVTAIATQGNPSKAQSYVSQYAVSYTEDGKNWKWFGQYGKNDKQLSRALLLRGNSDAHTVSKQYLQYKIKARAIRLHPTCWSSNAMSLRVDIYACVIDFDWKPVKKVLKHTGPWNCDKIMAKTLPSFEKWSLGNEGSGAVFQTEPLDVTSVDREGGTRQYEITAYQKRMLSADGMLVKSLLCHKQKSGPGKTSQKTGCCSNKSGKLLNAQSFWENQALDTMML